MVQAGNSADALAAARRALAARDADLADADRALAETLAGAHAIAVKSIRRLEVISAEIDSAATEQSHDSAAGAREVGRQLVARNREITEVISSATAAVDAKTVALKELTGRYQC
jgi:hypothetical protein